MSHTPLPWDYDEVHAPFYNDADGNSRGGGSTGVYEVFANVEIPDEEGEEGDTWTDTIVLVERASKANAQLIVTAVNNHHTLLKALKAAREELDHIVPGDCWATGPFTGDFIEDMVVCPGCRVIRQIDITIAKAEETTHE